MKSMKTSHAFLSVLACFASLAAVQAQGDYSLKIGDPAPPIKVLKWAKGTPIEKFEPGRVYVVDFWATWCYYCRMSMPHLSALARKYGDKVTVISIDVAEDRAGPDV